MVVVVRRGRRAGDQMSPLGDWGDGNLFVDRHVGSNTRYGCHLRTRVVRKKRSRQSDENFLYLWLMLASGFRRPLGVWVTSDREGPVRERLVDHVGHVRKVIKILKKKRGRGKRVMWEEGRRGRLFDPRPYENHPCLCSFVLLSRVQLSPSTKQTQSKHKASNNNNSSNKRRVSHISRTHAPAHARHRFTDRSLLITSHRTVHLIAYCSPLPRKPPLPSTTVCV